jgi:hypothetical protein
MSALKRVAAPLRQGGRAGAPGRWDAEGRTVPRAFASALHVKRFHDASTAHTGSNRLGAAAAEISLPKRPPEDAPGRTRTCDPLLRRGQQVLQATAASRQHRAVSDGAHICAALCCGSSLPGRFHSPSRAGNPLVRWRRDSAITGTRASSRLRLTAKASERCRVALRER